MTIEIQMLVCSVGLFILTVAVQASAGVLQMGLPWAFGNRDDAPATTGFAGRARRCVQNSIEAMVMFVPLVIAAVLAQQTDHWSALGAQVFLYGRAAYVAIYLIGIPYVRTLAWAAGLAGAGLVFYSLYV